MTDKFTQRLDAPPEYKLSLDLLYAAGIDEPVSVLPMGGGRNNKILHVQTSDDQHYVLKQYCLNHHETRDRFESEVKFLEFCASRGITSIPKLIFKDTLAKACLFEKVVGHKITTQGMTAAHVDQAFDFIKKLNHPRVNIEHLPNAADASFSIDQNMKTISLRLRNVLRIDTNLANVGFIASFIRDELLPCWSKLNKKLGAMFTEEERQTCIPASQIIYSPSDFGFHNILVDDEGQLTFLDFEYAGLDDPIKLVCDFLSMPDIPVRESYFELFLASLERYIDFNEFDYRKAHFLRECFKIKWACICLNPLLLNNKSKNAFASNLLNEEEVMAQFEKAKKLIDSVRIV